MFGAYTSIQYSSICESTCAYCESTCAQQTIFRVQRDEIIKSKVTSECSLWQMTMAKMEKYIDVGSLICIFFLTCSTLVRISTLQKKTLSLFFFFRVLCSFSLCPSLPIAFVSKTLFCRFQIIQFSFTHSIHSPFPLCLIQTIEYVRQNVYSQMRLQKNGLRTFSTLEQVDKLK